VKNQTVICGDCLIEMGKMRNGSVDIVVTSPPYNINMPYFKYSDSKPRAEYINWMLEAISEMGRLLTENGSVFLVMSAKPSDPSLPFEVITRVKDLKWQNHIMWVKSIAIGNDPSLSFGHYKPINSKRFEHSCFENVFHLTKLGSVDCDRLAIGLPYKWKCNRKNRKTGEKKPDLRPRGNAWYVPYETIQRREERFHHPAPFPAGLAEMCIKFHGVGGKPIVLDPFVGIGNTLLATAKLGLTGIGIDLDESYCDVSRKQLEMCDGEGCLY